MTSFLSVPFPSALLMVESEGVHLLVLHGAVAADAGAARLVVDVLRAPYATDVGVAPPAWKMELEFRFNYLTFKVCSISLVQT